MTDPLQPPPERDMPAGRSARMRADLLAAIDRSQRRRRTRPRRLALPAAGLVVALGATVAVVARAGDDDVEVLAMSVPEMSPTLRDAAAQCLRWSADQGLLIKGEPPTPVSLADLAVATQRGHHAVVLFLGADRYVTCEVSGRWNRSGGMGHDTWESPRWMPGPVERLGLASTDVDGGRVLVTGRVSDRVHRLVLDHGDGHTTAARLSRGVFGLISANGDVRNDAELVSYGADGREIGRVRLFPRPGEPDRQCYVDPSGTVVTGRPGRACLPAEPWTR